MRFPKARAPPLDTHRGMAAARQFWLGATVAVLLHAVTWPPRCSAERGCWSHSAPGDLIIGGLFPIHYVAGRGRCTEAQSRWGTMLSEAFLFAVESVNGRHDLLPNVTLGYEMRDDCRSDDLALWHALSLVNALNPGETSGLCPPRPRPKVLGLIGTSETPTSIAVAKAAALYKVPLVSYSASGDELGDEIRFPFFFRTVPQNSLQVQAMIDILHTYDWVYVSLLYATESDYLHSALRFQEIAPDHGICVAYSAAIRATADEAEVERIVGELDRYPKARTVAVIGDKFTGLRVMRAAQKAGMAGRYQWLGNNRWGYLSVEEGVADIADGAIFIRSLSYPVDGFAEYVRAKRPGDPGTSPWLRDLQLDFMASQGCTNLTQCPLQVNSGRGAVVDSVHALAVALHDHWAAECGGAVGADCPLSSVLGGNGQGAGSFEDGFLGALSNVSFSGTDGGRVSFDSSGNSGGRFSITNLRRGEETEMGVWTSGLGSVRERFRLNEDAVVRFVGGASAVPPSVCTEQCQTGYIVVPLEEKCCWGCKACLPNEIVVSDTSCRRCGAREWPDATRTRCQTIVPSAIDWTETAVVVILATAGLGVTLCCLTIAGLAAHWGHPLIKASSRELSSICVAGLTVTFAASPVLIARPTPLSCIAFELVLSTCTTLVYAPTLLKVTRIYRIFRKGRKSTRRPRFTSPKHQVVACLAIIAVQVILSILSAVLAPSTPHELTSYARLVPAVELVCYFGPGFLVSCAFNLALILACCLLAFLARKVPSNYNESKFIAVSVYSTLVLCLAAVPVYVTAVAALQRVATVCFAVILNAYLTLLCLYLPKLYAVRFVESQGMNMADWRGTTNTTVATNQVGPSTSANQVSVVSS